MLRRSILASALLASAFGAAGLLAGCASADPNYYTLQARPGVPVGGMGPRLVELRRIGLAGYLDRPEIVRDNADFRLRLTSNDRWGEPFGDLVARVLAEDLGTRLPGSSVFTSAGAISATPDATLELDLQRFDLDASGQVVLLAQVAAVRGRGRDGQRDAPRAITERIVVPTTGRSTADQVAAMSQALGLLADRIALLLGR